MDDDKARESRERLIDDGNERKTKTKNHSASVVVVVVVSPSHSFFICSLFVCLVVSSSSSYPSLFSLDVFQGNSSPRQNFLTRSLNHFLFLSSFPIVFLFFIIRQRQSHFGFFLYCIIESECIITNDK